MKRVLKFLLRSAIAFIGIGVLFTLIIAVAIGAVFKFADWRAVAAEVVRAESGYTLHLSARPAVTFAPVFSITAAAASLRYPAASVATDGPIAVAFDAFAFTLPWRDLWQRRGNAASVDIAALQLNADITDLIATDADDTAATVGAIATPAFGGRLPSIAPVIRRLSVTDADFDLGIGDAGRITVTNADFTVTAIGDTVSIDAFTANLYGGSVAVTGTIDYATEPPTVHVRKTFTDVDLQRTMMAAGISDLVHGIGDMSVDLSGRIVPRSGLSGDADFAITGRIALPGMDGALGDIHRGDTAADYRLSGTVQLQHGNARNNDLRIIADDFTADGDGIVELASGRVDYLLRVHLRGGISVPLRIGGTLGAPTYAPE